MSTFRVISCVGIVIGVGLSLVLAMRGLRRRREPAKASLPIAPPLRRLSVWERLLLLAAGVSFAVLAVTGFFPAIVHDEPLRGYLLMIHMVAAPVFAVALAAMALTWQRECRFRRHDAAWLRGALLRRQPRNDLPAGRFDAAQKIAFWTLVSCGASCIATMALAMLPLWGPEGIALLVEIHRYSALAALVAAIFHACRTAWGKPGALGGLLSGKVAADWAKRHHAIWYQTIAEEQTP
jgi:formate dehydrogenase subunit gamma